MNIAAILITVVLSLIGMFSSAVVSYSPPTPPPPITRDALMAEFNLYRKEHNLNPVKHSDLLCPFAEERVREIQTDWSHKGFRAEVDNFTNAHREIDWIGENLAKEYDDAKAVFVAWDNSPTHKENLINPEYSIVCFTVDNRHIVQMLGGFFKPSPSPTYNPALPKRTTKR